MSHSRSLDEAGRRAFDLYEGGIRQEVEAKHQGEYLVINLDSGEYLIEKDWIRASDGAEVRFANAQTFLIRVGHDAAVRIGFRAAA